MEGNKAQRSKLFKIPIEEYEEDMNTETSKGKKREIFELLTNSNNLHSEKEFKEIKDKLHRACERGDLELIKIYLNETIKNESQDMIFKIDKTNNTASLFRVNTKNDLLIIPRSVNHESIDYLITSISGINFRFKSLNFAEDSAVKTIYGYAFENSLLNEIYFPKCLCELKEGWCFGINKYMKITISPLNDNFRYEKNEFLLGKSDQSKDKFDILLFANIDINRIIIPPNVRKICSHAFDQCMNLRFVYISKKSKLKTIGDYAFSCSKIKEIFIPPKVSRICHSAFYYCDDLIKVKIPTDSNLQIIESYAFNNTKIEEIYFPASLHELGEDWCHEMSKLKKIDISPMNDKFIFKDNKYLLGKIDQNDDEFNNLLFVRRDIEEIHLPSNIKIISPNAFENCELLKKVEIPTNSNLQIIGSNAFSRTKIDEIFIPSRISKISKCSFFSCENLIKIDIPTDSDLQIIEERAFAFSKINEFIIPPKVSKIGERAFAMCKYLNKIDFATNSNLQTIEKNAFCISKSKGIIIPPKLSKIGEQAFSILLQIIEISEDSILESIPLSAFSQDQDIIIMIPLSKKKLII